VVASALTVRNHHIQVEHLRDECNHLVVTSNIGGETLNSGRTYRKKYRERNSIQHIEAVVKVGDVGDSAGMIYKEERI